MEKTINCEICKKVFSSINSLSNHKRIYHYELRDVTRSKNINDNLYHCKFCDKKYKNYQSRWYHEKICNLQITTIHETQNSSVLPTACIDTVSNIVLYNDNNSDLLLQNSVKDVNDANLEHLTEKIELKDEIIRLQKKLLSSKRLSTCTFKAVNKILMDRSKQTMMNHSNNTTNSQNNTTNSHNTITNNNNIQQICNIGNEELSNILTETQKNKF
jgi:hypothetical protein